MKIRQKENLLKTYMEYFVKNKVILLFIVVIFLESKFYSLCMKTTYPLYNQIQNFIRYAKA